MYLLRLLSYLHLLNPVRDAGCPVVVVANKLDKLKKSELEGNLQRIRETL